VTLNWRHKFGLILTLVAVGCGLFLDSSIKQTVGIAIVGLAFSWLIGSITPRVGVAFAVLTCAVGLYVAAALVWSDWNSAQKSAAEYDVAIADLQTAVKNAAIIPPPSPGYTFDTSDTAPTRNVTIPSFVQKWMLPWEQYAQNPQERRFPQTMSDAEIMQDFKSSMLLPRPAFHLASAVRAHAWQILGGLALFASGLWILGWSLRRIRIGIEQQISRCVASS
jgi:hypothetical protein